MIISGLSPEMAHMPAACVFTMASSKEIQREVKILLVIHSFATTRTNVHNLQELNTKKIPLQQKKKKKKRKKRQSRGGRRGGGGGGEGGGYWYSLKISIVKRTWNTCSSSFTSLGGFIRVYSFRLYSGIIKAAHPPVSWLPFPCLLFFSLLFSSLPPFPPPLSNKPPHFLPRLYTQNTQLHFLFSLRSPFLDSARQQWHGCRYKRQL